MGCMCADCRFAKGTEENMALCSNWDSEAYGMEMDLVGDGCDYGEVDIVKKALEEQKAAQLKEE